MRFHQLNSKDEKGSAAVMVMSVILILTTLGLVALMGSVSSVKMGSRYNAWSNEFYELDKTAESIVKDIDLVLSVAEAKTRAYMESGSYGNENYTDSDIIDKATQDFFYNNAWMKTNTYESFIAAGKTASEYQTALNAGYKECFNKVYYYYMARGLNAYLYPPPAVPPTTPPVVAKSPTPALLAAYLNVKVTNVPPTSWASYTPQNLPLIITSESPTDPTKKVEVELRIIPPTYETVIKEINQPIKANPLWGYALAAGEGVTIAGDAKIGGDIIASGGDISIISGSKVETRGNIYTNRDLTLETNAELNAISSDTAGLGYAPLYVKKKNIYKNSDLGVDITNTSIFNESVLNPFIEGGTRATGDMVPFFYKDLDSANWGNVYARNLIIKEGSSSAKVTIDGNIITYDDIELNGLSGNEITINGNYVGVVSESKLDPITNELDPNASSTVLNNSILDPADGTTILDNKITLNAGIIVPGTAFREFDSEVAGAQHAYYQTIESVTGRDRPLFEAYLDPASTNIKYLTANGSQAAYALRANESINARETFFINKLNTTAITTNVIADDLLNGYALGAAVYHKGVASLASIRLRTSNPLVGFTANRDNWQTVDTALPAYFDAKTKFFGFDKPMSDLVNEPSGSTAVNALDDATNMTYLTGDSSFDVSGGKGIVYCTGNLTLTGNGVFEGVIIAKKSIIITGNPTIRYSDGEVTTAITDEKGQPVRDFFDNEVGLMDYAYYKDYDAGGGTKTVLKRYQIARWQEIHQ